MANGLNISFQISAIDDFSKTMQNLEKQTKKAFDTVGTIGTALTAAGAVGAVGLGVAAKAAMDFESQLSSIKAVSGATSRDMEKLKDLAVEMGAKTKYSSVQAAQGIEELIKAGVGVTEIVNGGLEGALSLAVAGELELADAAEIASTALNAFKADGLDVAKAADILAGAANASATSVGELKYGLSMVSAVASGVGLTFADTNTALAVFAQNGLKGSDAGTSLKTMLLNLSPSTKEAKEAMIDLGLATEDGKSLFYDANGSIKSMAEISELLKTKLSGLTDEQRQLALKTMFGTDAIRAANILYKEGANGVNKMFGEMSKVKAVDVMNERMNNTKGALEELKGALETAAISLGDALLPAIKVVVKFVKKLVDWFNGLSDGTKSTIAIILALVTAFALIAGPIMLLLAILPSIVAGFAAIAGAIGIASSSLLLIIGVVGAAVAAVVGIGIALVVAYKKVDWFRKAVDDAFAFLKYGFRTLMDVIRAMIDGDWKKAWEISKDYVAGNLKAIKTIVSNAFDKIKESAIKKLSEWKDAIIGWADETRDSMLGKLDEWKTNILGWFTEQAVRIVEKLSGWGSAIEEWFKSMPSRIVLQLMEWGASIRTWMEEQNAENIRQFTEWGIAIQEWFASIPEKITEQLAQWLIAITTWFLATKEAITTKLQEWWTSIGEWFAAIPGRIATALTQWGIAILLWYDETKNNIKTKLGEWWTSISTWFKEAPGKIGTALQNWWNKIGQWFSEIPARISAKLEEWWTAIKSWFKSVPDKPEIKNMGKNMVDKVSEGNSEKKKDFMSKLGKIIVDVALGALAFAGIALLATGREIIKRFIDGIKDVDMIEVGKDLVRGLINGMGAMIGGVAEKAKSIAMAAKDTVSGWLGIHSPSRVMMEVGEFTGEGFVKGIGSMVRDVQNVSGDLASAAIPNTSGFKASESNSQATLSENPSQPIVLQTVLPDGRVIAEASFPDINRLLYNETQNAKARRGYGR
jgi:TP901 family phage tail tape measure protein